MEKSSKLSILDGFAPYKRKLLICHHKDVAPNVFTYLFSEMCLLYIIFVCHTNIRKN